MTHSSRGYGYDDPYQYWAFVWGQYPACIVNTGEYPRYPTPCIIYTRYAGMLVRVLVQISYARPERPWVFVRHPYNTRNFGKFFKTFIPVPGTSVSCVKRSYPYNEAIIPTEDKFVPILDQHTLEIDI